MSAWVQAGKTTEQITSITVKEFEKRFNTKPIAVLDVRKDGEYNSVHLEGAHIQHLSLDSIHQKIKGIESQKTYHIYCGGGYRSVIAASILKANGFSNVIDIAGGFTALKKTQLPMVNGVFNAK